MLYETCILKGLTVEPPNNMMYNDKWQRYTITSDCIYSAPIADSYLNATKERPLVAFPRTSQQKYNTDFVEIRGKTYPGIATAIHLQIK